MVQRLKLLQDTYMPLEGQWQVVLSGSVVDAPDTFGISARNFSVLSPTEPAGTLKKSDHIAPVRDVKGKK